MIFEVTSYYPKVSLEQGLPMEWTIPYFLLANGIVALGALLQAATGLGAGLIVVPLLALISFHLVPGPVIFASLILTVTMASTGRKHIDFSKAKVTLLGIFLGTLIAVSILGKISTDTLGLVFGIMVLLVSYISMKAPSIALTKRNTIIAGTISGFLGTSAGIGAPILALLFQHFSGKNLRATLAFLYAVSSLVMLSLLHYIDLFGEEELISGILLMPGFILGFLLSPKLTTFIDKGYARPAVLIISMLSACMLIGKSLMTFF